jgi:sialic acid synthase SpsE
MEGSDHILSSDFSEMKELVESVDNINLLLGDGIKKIQPNEYITLNAQKKSLYALRNIKRGEIFNDKNISIKGPSGGILPKYKKVIVNKKSKNNIAADQPITWEDV